MRLYLLRLNSAPQRALGGAVCSLLTPLAHSRLNEVSSFGVSFEVEVEDNLRLHFTGLRIKVRHKGVSFVVFFLWRGSLIVYASMRLNSEPFFGSELRRA